MKQENIIIRRETQIDHAAVEHLTREAFWNVYRPGCLEHYVVHVLREDPDFVPEPGPGHGTGRGAHRPCAIYAG